MNILRLLLSKIYGNKGNNFLFFFFFFFTDLCQKDLMLACVQTFTNQFDSNLV